MLSLLPPVELKTLKPVREIFCSERKTPKFEPTCLRNFFWVRRGGAINLTTTVKWQSTSRQKVQTDTPIKLFFQKCSNLTFLGGFSNFQNWIFCHFWFSIKSKFILNCKLTFVSAKKFLDYPNSHNNCPPSIIAPPCENRVKNFSQFSEKNFFQIFQKKNFFQILFSLR